MALRTDKGRGQPRLRAACNCKSASRGRRIAGNVQAERRTKRLAPARPAVCVGIDLAGVEHRETGVAVLRDGRLERLTSVGSDVEILEFAALAGPGGTVAI